MSAPFDLELALRQLGPDLSAPTAGPAFAERVRARIEAEQPRRAGASWWPRPVRRSLALALAALLIAAAAVTAAIGFGLPGLRIIFGPVETASPGATIPPGAPGSSLGLGTPVTLEEARELVQFEVVLPGDATGPPDVVYVAGRRVSLVWAPAPELPGTANPGVGLLIMELEGVPNQDMVQKMIQSGTHVEAITVDGAAGYWIAGDSHILEFIAPDGTLIRDSRRIAGNTLVWTQDGITYRLEGEFERDAALELAVTLR